MKKAILHTLSYFALGVIACAALIGSLVLLLAMPDILAWIADYLGGFLTYTLFFLSIAIFISYCINSK